MRKKPELHEDIRRAHKVKGSSDRGFGIVFAVFFTVIGLIPLIGGGEVRIWSLAIAGAFLLVAILYPRLFAPANRYWTKFALFLSTITTPIIMGLMFFGGVTPIGFLMRLFGGDPLNRRIEKDRDSYWIERDVTVPEPGAMRNMF